MKGALGRVARDSQSHVVLLRNRLAIRPCQSFLLYPVVFAVSSNVLEVHGQRSVHAG